MVGCESRWSGSRHIGGQPFNNALTRLVSLAATVVRPSSRRVRFDGLCSSRCRRLAFWRTILPAPVRRNRFEAPLWVLALGIFPLTLLAVQFFCLALVSLVRRRCRRPRPP